MNKLDDFFSSSNEPNGDNSLLEGTFSEINEETKKNHSWLEELTSKQITHSPIIQPLTYSAASTAYDAMLSKAKNNPGNTFGWGSLTEDCNQLNLHLNVDPKMGEFMRVFPDIILRVKKMHKQASGGATHKCEFSSYAPTSPTVFDRANRVLAVISGATNLDDFRFDLSPAMIADYYYRAHGKAWLKLSAVVKDDSIFIYC